MSSTGNVRNGGLEKLSASERGLFRNSPCHTFVWYSMYLPGEKPAVIVDPVLHVHEKDNVKLCSNHEFVAFPYSLLPGRELDVHFARLEHPHPVANHPG